MSVEVTSRVVREPDAVRSYDAVLKAVHWASVLLVTAAFTAVWASHLTASREQSAILLELHRSLGITVFGLTLFRLAWRWHAPIPALPADLPAAQKVAARVTEWGLSIASGATGLGRRPHQCPREACRALFPRTITPSHWHGQGTGQASDDDTRAHWLSPLGAHRAARCCGAVPSFHSPRWCPGDDAAPPPLIIQLSVRVPETRSALARQVEAF